MRKAMRVVLKFWCNWQMRQSLHADLLASGVDVCSESVSAVAPARSRRYKTVTVRCLDSCAVENEKDQQQTKPTLKVGAVVLKNAG